MAEITHQPCPNCDSSDGYSFNTEKGVGHCFVCNGSSKEAPGEDYPVVEKIEYDPSIEPTYVVETNDKPIHVFTPKFLEHRGVTARTMEEYGVEGYPDKHVYVYPDGGRKTRTFPKTFTTNAGFKTNQLFGQQLFPVGVSRKITITEGELDAMSAYQMLKDSRYVNPVVSLPSSNPGQAFWADTKPYLDQFDEIIVCIEFDEPGNAIADKINRLYPGKVKRMSFENGYKDANKMLEVGKAREFKNLWWGAKPIVPDNINVTVEDFLSVYEDEEEGTFYPTGIEGLDEKIKGLFEGHYTLIKAPTGIGKTEFTRYIEHTLMKQGAKIAAWHLEEKQLRSLLGLVCYEMGVDVTRKDLVIEKGLEDQVKMALTKLAESELYVQFSMDEDCSSDDVVDQIKFLREAYGVNFILMEPVQDILNLKPADREAVLAQLSIRLSKVAAQTGVGIILVAHTNKEGDAKYCDMLSQRASVVIDLKRDKKAEDEIERNTTHIWIEKNRPTSLEGYGGEVFFDLETFTIKTEFMTNG